MELQPQLYLVYCGQFLAVGREGEQASSQVDQAADLQVRVGAAGGRRIDGFPRAHHVAVAPLDTAGNILHFKTGRKGTYCGLRMLGTLCP